MLIAYVIGLGICLYLTCAVLTMHSMTALSKRYCRSESPLAILLLPVECASSSSWGSDTPPDEVWKDYCLGFWAWWGMPILFAISCIIAVCIACSPYVLMGYRCIWQKTLKKIIIDLPMLCS